MENNDKEKVLGIDLGTTNSVVSVLLSGEPEIIPSAEGLNQYGKVFPSYVAFLEDGEILVGELARRQAANNPKNTVTTIKRKMGTDEKINIQGKDYIPQEISALILKKIKKDAEEYIGEKIEKAIITVPAYFNDNERTATKDAGTIAGLDVIRLVNEPTAASLAYGFKKDSDKGFKIMVFDFGGGTLDVTILNLEDGVFDVKSTSGDMKLGGTDIDEVIMNHVIDEFEKESNIDLRDNEQAISRLKEACENAKIELSTVSDTEINLTFIALDSNGNPKNLIVKLSRDKLEELIDPIIKKSKIPMKQALEDANIDPDDIDKLILVGGTTRIPAVQDSVEKYIGKTPEKGIDPMECVAKGAAIQGAVLEGEIEGLVLFDVIPQSLGNETIGDRNSILIEKNTKIPAKKTKPFTTVRDFQQSIICNVLQGESIIASENVSLGEFKLEGIEFAFAGMPHIDVTFEVDSNGIIHATAQDQDTGVKNSITIKSPRKLTEKEIQDLK